MEGVNETENHLADIVALQSFDKETLSKVIEPLTSGFPTTAFS